MKKKVSLIFVSIFLMLGIVCGALVYNADTLFLTSTSESTQYEEKKDEETKIQASGNWSDNYGDWTYSGTTNTGHLEVHINNAQDLAKLAQFVKTGVSAKGTSYKFCDSSTVVKLKGDIDMSAHYWDYPIGDGKYAFQGTFDGQGYIISGLTIKQTSKEIMNSVAAYDGKYGIGLFGVVNNATIKNFTLQGGSFYINTDSASIKVRMGGVVGMTRDSSSVTISSVINNMSKVELAYAKAVDSYIGGLIGLTEGGYVNDCYNFAKVYGRSNTIIGGIAGSFLGEGAFYRCGNFGEVVAWLSSASSTMFSGYGGIVGEAVSKSFRLEDCVNYGKVHAYSNSTSYQSMNVGGILGCGLRGVCINRCLNYGQISGTAYVGGIVGGLVIFNILNNIPSVLINSINYGEVKGTTTWGKLCGILVGDTNSIKGCNVTGKDNRIGAWQNWAGNSISWGNANIDWWTSIHFKASFFKKHDYDFSGSVDGWYVSNWKSTSVTLNGGASSGWIATTLVYDEFSYSGKNTEYKYSLVPYSLIGAATLNTKYARGSSYTSYAFDGDENDKNFMKITFNEVSSEDISEEAELSYSNATFYYIKGRSQTVSNTSLKFKYNANLFKYKTVTANQSGVSPSMNSDANSTSIIRTNYLSFNAKRYSSISFTVVFQSQPKTLSFKYKIGRLKIPDIPEENNNNNIYENASYNYFDLGTPSDFLTKSGATSQSYYYKQNINFEIIPNKGYAVLSIIKKKSNDNSNLSMTEADRIHQSKIQDWFLDRRNICNTHYMVASKLQSGGNGSVESTAFCYTDINPSNFEKATVNYKFLYDSSASVSIKEEIVVYIVPIRYEGIVISLDNANNNSHKMNEKVYAFQGDGGVSAIRAGASEYAYAYSYFKKMQLSNYEKKQENESSSLTTITPIINQLSSDFLNYGYKYTLNAVSYNNIDILPDKNGRQIDGQTNLQLDTSKSIKFCMSALLDAAIQKDSDRGNKILHIVIKRKLINYEVNIINMVDSYKSTAYSSKTNIGGNSNIYKENDSSQNLFKGNVEDTAVYKFIAKPGYSYIGTTMHDNYSNPGNEDKDFFSMKGDGAKKKVFRLILNKYMEICNWDVKKLSKNSDGNYVLNIYAYYTLQSYNLSFCTEIDGFQKSANYTFTPTNFASSQAKASGEGTNATATAKYYAPVTLRVDSVDGNRKNVKFLGWFMGDKLLSLDREYKFLLDPEYVVTDNSKISGEISGKENSSNYGFALIAKFASYDERSGSLTSSGNKTIYINNANDLLLLSQKVNSGTTYEGYVIKQTANIDMENVIFNPIGTSEHQFKGTYDGQNYIISNLNFICEAYNGYLKHLYNVGLFGYTNGATIKNLTIKDSTFNAFGKAGIFVAEAYNSHLANLNNFNSGLTINEVNFFDIYGNVCSSQDLDYANIRGRLPAELSDANNSSFSWETILYPNSRSNLAGLVGYMNGGSAFACSVNASIEGNAGVSNFQGLVGNLTASAKIDQCCVENSSNNGGLTVANITSGSITNSYYRYANNTEYVGLSGGTQNSIPTDTTIWFRLANGNWALRVMYWS